MDEYLLADTSVVSKLTKASVDSEFYGTFLLSGRLAINFQALAELRGCKFGDQRMQRLEDLIAATLVLPHSVVTSSWYARVAEMRAGLRKLKARGGDAGDADMWVVSSALEFQLDLLSHDGPQIELARALGVRGFTNLPQLRDGNPSLP
ncbi:MAG: hypothetical protein WEB00_05415 [Dehalococcoidia bacterium]